MDFFRDVSQKARGAAQNLGRKTKEIAEITRLNGEINAKRAEADEIYVQIGRTFRESAPEAQRNAVNRLESEISALQIQMDRLRGQRACPSCGTSQPTEARFCSACGARMEEPVRPVEPEPPKDEGGRGSVVIRWPSDQEESDK